MFMQSYVKVWALKNNLSNQNVAVLNSKCSVFNTECTSFVKLLIGKLLYVTNKCLASCNFYYDSHSNLIQQPLITAFKFYL